MLNTDAGEELKTLETQKTQTSDLRTRMDEEFSYYRGDPEKYNIPKKEGEWDSVITNRAMVEVNRVISDISGAARKLWIPVQDEDHRSRKELSDTEHTALGLIHLADSVNEDSPSNSDVQSLLAAYRVHRGWSAFRFIVREEDNKLVPDLAVWDPRNVYWVEGKSRLIWVCNVRWATKGQVTDEYPGWNGSADSNGFIEIHDVWAVKEGKTAQEGVIISGEWVKDPEDVEVGSSKLDYIPIRIKAGASLPLLHGDKQTDNIKYIGQGYITQNKALLSLESRLLSYQLTRAGQLAKSPILVNYDSSQSPLPPPFAKDPFVKGRTIFLDKAKGQEFIQQLTPPSGGEINEIYVAVQRLLSTGGLNAVAFGNINTALPAQGIDILSHAALAVEQPYINGVQSDFVWLAGEATRQFKNGKFDEQEFEGYDKSNNSFHAKVTPSQINEDWRFTCRLIPDLLRDKVSMVQAAAQAMQSGLVSEQTARDEFQIVVDTDLEGTKVAKERARKILGIGEMEAVIALIDDFVSTKDPAKGMIISHAWQALQVAVGGQGGQLAQQGQPAQQGQLDNQVTARRAQPSVPGPVRQAAQTQNTGL